MDVNEFGGGQERGLLSVTSPRFPIYGGSIMFLGAVCFDYRTELVAILKRSINAHFYAENILEE